VAAITWDDVVGYASQMAAVSATARALILDYVNITMSVDNFGGEDTPKTKLARVLLACHLGACGPVGGATAAILTGQSEGGLSQTYSLPPIPIGADPFWSRTGYGLSFIALLRSSPRARLPMVV
jgi:Protein of unknown function (DUF4054)